VYSMYSLFVLLHDVIADRRKQTSAVVLCDLVELDFRCRQLLEELLGVVLLFFVLLLLFDYSLEFCELVHFTYRVRICCIS